jgi:hypothetical protein
MQMGNQVEEKVQKILDALEGLEFGSVHITVHDGVITQIDTTEKTRFSLKKHQKA